MCRSPMAYVMVMAIPYIYIQPTSQWRTLFAPGATTGMAAKPDLKGFALKIIDSGKRNPPRDEEKNRVWRA